MLADEYPELNNEERMEVYLSNLPSGAGYRNFLHYGQLIEL